MSFEFEPVKLGKEAKKYQRKETFKHIGKTLLFMLGGILFAIGYQYAKIGTWTELDQESIKNAVFMGAFIGFFLTNSPCAKGRC